MGPSDFVKRKMRLTQGVYAHNILQVSFGSPGVVWRQSLPSNQCGMSGTLSGRSTLRQRCARPLRAVTKAACARPAAQHD